MLTYPHIDPVLIRLGPLAIYWYGVMYLLGFLLAFWFSCRHGLKLARPWSREQVMDLLFYAAIGVIFGGSIGYVLFYEPALLIEDPLQILRFWSGRSFHGGLIGVLIAIYLFCKRHKRYFWEVGDFMAPVIPFGLGLGRIGNFINGELWGRVTDLPWGMVFPGAGVLPRHPSQLYEFLLEGVALFILLQWYIRKPRPFGSVSGLFLILYGLFRFWIEFYRAPDPYQGFIVGDWMTMGQLLSIPMVLFGGVLMIYAYYPGLKLRRHS